MQARPAWLGVHTPWFALGSYLARQFKAAVEGKLRERGWDAAAQPRVCLNAVPGEALCSAAGDAAAGTRGCC